MTSTEIWWAVGIPMGIGLLGCLRTRLADAEPIAPTTPAAPAPPSAPPEPGSEIRVITLSPCEGRWRADTPAAAPHPAPRLRRGDCTGPVRRSPAA